ncbi:hypothetical protein HDU96_001453, partial [Phlyctochytrium bullatum]
MLAFDNLSEQERHILVAPGRFAEYATLAGFHPQNENPSPARIATVITPLPRPISRAASINPLLAEATAPVHVQDSAVVPALFQDNTAMPAAMELNVVLAGNVAAATANPQANDEPQRMLLAAARATPPPVATPTPAPLRSVRSRVRMTTPVRPQSPPSPLAGHGHFRPPLSAAAPPTLGGASFYTPAAGASPQEAPRMTSSPIPFGGWVNTWSPPPAPAAQTLPTPADSPHPRLRSATPVFVPDAWRPPVVNDIPASDAHHYAERIATMNQREASLVDLEKRLLALVDQLSSLSTQQQPMPAVATNYTAVPPSPGGGSSSSSSNSSSNSHRRPNSRGSFAHRDNRMSEPHSDFSAAAIKVPAALIKQAADDVAKIRFDGNTGMTAFRWFARLRTALTGRLLSPSNINGMFSNMDEAYLRLRTRQWFPNGADYDPKWMVVEGDLPTWDLFADFCRNAFFRDVSEEDLQQDLNHFKWSRTKEPFSLVWAHLLGLNSYLSSDFRLSESSLRHLWCEGCDSAPWKKAVRQLTIPGFPGLSYTDPVIPMKAVFDALDSHVNLATGPSEGASFDPSDLQRQIQALERQVRQSNSRQNGRRERLNVVAFAKSPAAADQRGLPVNLPSQGASRETRNRYVSKVMSLATDFLAQYPEVEELNEDDEDDLHLLINDPSALPESIVTGELFYTVEESRPKYKPGFPSKDKRDFASKDKKEGPGRGQSPHPRPPTPGASAPSS